MSPTRRDVFKFAAASALATKLAPAVAEAAPQTPIFTASMLAFGTPDAPNYLGQRVRLLNLIGFADGGGELIIQGANAMIPSSGRWNADDYVPAGLKPNPGFPRYTLTFDAAEFAEFRDAFFAENGVIHDEGERTRADFNQTIDA